MKIHVEETEFWPVYIPSVESKYTEEIVMTKAEVAFVEDSLMQFQKSQQIVKDKIEELREKNANG